MCSIIRVGERLHKVLGQIDLAHWTQVSDRCPLGYLFLLPLLKPFGCYGNFKFPLTDNGKIEIGNCYPIADILTRFLQKCLLSGPPSSISFQ